MFITTQKQIYQMIVDKTYSTKIHFSPIIYRRMAMFIHVFSSDNLANLFTKALLNDSFKNFVHFLTYVQTRESYFALNSFRLTMVFPLDFPSNIFN